jgi:hypothetical protein
MNPVPSSLPTQISQSTYQIGESTYPMAYGQGFPSGQGSKANGAPRARGERGGVVSIAACANRQMSCTSRLGVGVASASMLSGTDARTLVSPSFRRFPVSSKPDFPPSLGNSPHRGDTESNEPSSCVPSFSVLTGGVS